MLPWPSLWALWGAGYTSSPTTTPAGPTHPGPDYPSTVIENERKARTHPPNHSAGTPPQQKINLQGDRRGGAGRGGVEWGGAGLWRGGGSQVCRPDNVEGVRLANV